MFFWMKIITKDFIKWYIMRKLIHAEKRKHLKNCKFIVFVILCVCLLAFQYMCNCVWVSMYDYQCVCVSMLVIACLSLSISINVCKSVYVIMCFVMFVCFCLGVCMGRSTQLYIRVRHCVCFVCTCFILYVWHCVCLYMSLCVFLCLGVEVSVRVLVGVLAIVIVYDCMLLCLYFKWRLV